MTAANQGRNSREARIEAAAQWFVMLRTADISSEDLERWNDWAKIEANQQAFDAIARRWQHADALRNIPLPSPEELEADDYEGTDPVTTYIANKEAPSAKRYRYFVSASRSRRSLWITAAAAVALVICAALVTGQGEGVRGILFGDRPSQDQMEVFETGEAQQRQLRLSDGSTIELGAKTAISVSYYPRSRTVVLDRGEALFKVVHDPRRPFVVVAGRGSITAVGTAFDVKRDDDRVIISVTEGKVSVAQRHSLPTAREIEAPPAPNQPLASGSPISVLLAQGQQIAYNAGGDLGTVERADPESATAWRDGRLLYHNEQLKYVVTDVNRYSSKQIVFGDRSAEQLIYTGTVFQGQIEDWLHGLEHIFPLEVVRTDSDHVLLRSRQAP